MNNEHLKNHSKLCKIVLRGWTKLSVLQLMDMDLERGDLDRIFRVKHKKRQSSMGHMFISIMLVEGRTRKARSERRHIIVYSKSQVVLKKTKCTSLTNIRMR
jgi:hypothetical protein